MDAKLPMLLVFLATAGCASTPRATAKNGALRHNAPPSAGAAATEQASEPEAASLPPAEALFRADLAYESQLGASRGQFDRDRQIAVLREAMLLYTQFLERAEGQPELLPAIRKSRERIADVKATIEFLEQQDKPGGEPPHAATQ